MAIPNFGQRKMDELMEDLEDEDQIVDILSERLKLWRSECEVRFFVLFCFCFYFKKF